MKNSFRISEKRYLRRLEWIRAISCVLVLFYHLNILKGGYLAVCTFLVISGYLSCTSALNNSNFSAKSYYKKKLYIPLIFTVALSVVIVKCINDIRWINLKQETISVVFGYNNFWQLKANLDYFTRHIDSPFMHLWYISILIQFDLFFPIIFVFLRKIEKKYKNNVSVIVVGLCSIILTIMFFYMSKTQNIMEVYYNTFTRVFSIFYGVFLALILHKYNMKLPKVLVKNNKIIFMIYCLVLFLLGIFVSAEENNYAIYMIITSLISVRLIRYSLFEKKKRRSTFIDKVVSFIAKFSYEIYLAQYPIIFLMQSISDSNVINTLFIIVFTFIISFLIHTLVYKHFANKYLNAIKKIFIRIDFNNKLFYSCNRERL